MEYVFNIELSSTHVQILKKLCYETALLNRTIIEDITDELNNGMLDKSNEWKEQITILEKEYSGYIEIINILSNVLTPQKRFNTDTYIRTITSKYTL